MKRKWKAVTVGMMAASVLLGACGQAASGNLEEAAMQTESAGGDGTISESSPYYGKGYDLGTTENIVMYVLGDEPTDMQKVLDEVNNNYLLPNLNTTLDVRFLNWSDYQTKYSLILAGGEDVDLIYTAPWCYYNEEAVKGAFRALDMDFIQTYLPYTYAEQPDVSWEQAKIGDTIYAVPKGNATWGVYDFVVARQDLIDEYQLTEPHDWDGFKEYLAGLAQIQDKTGVVPFNNNANRNQTKELYLQTRGYDYFTLGFDYFYKADGEEALPDSDKITYLYTSDVYKDYVHEMVELADLGAWSSDAINDTNDASAYFENGTSGCLAWNTSAIDAGEKLEAAGLGTFGVYDLSPDLNMARGRYNGDMTAIATNSKDPERAALVLDYIKSDVDLNRTLMGGIKGEHWDLNEDGQRVQLDAADNYKWNGWSWALNRADEPVLVGTDERQLELMDSIESRELHAEVAGFTFDSSKVATELSVVNSIVDEYEYSFALGIYGDDTDAKLEEFVQKLEAAGLDKVTEELKSQYEAYKEAHQ